MLAWQQGKGGGSRRLEQKQQGTPVARRRRVGRDSNGLGCPVGQQCGRWTVVVVLNTHQPHQAHEVYQTLQFTGCSHSWNGLPILGVLVAPQYWETYTHSQIGPPPVVGSLTLLVWPPYGTYNLRVAPSNGGLTLSEWPPYWGLGLPPPILWVLHRHLHCLPFPTTPWPISAFICIQRAHQVPLPAHGRAKI